MPRPRKHRGLLQPAEPIAAPKVDAITAQALIGMGRNAREHNAESSVADPKGGMWRILPNTIDNHAHITVQRRYGGDVSTRSIRTDVYSDDHLLSAINQLG